MTFDFRPVSRMAVVALILTMGGPTISLPSVSGMYRPWPELACWQRGFTKEWAHGLTAFPPGLW